MRSAEHMVTTQNRSLRQSSTGLLPSLFKDKVPPAKPKQPRSALIENCFALLLPQLPLEAGFLICGGFNRDVSTIRRTGSDDLASEYPADDFCLTGAQRDCGKGVLPSASDLHRHPQGGD